MTKTSNPERAYEMVRQIEARQGAMVRRAAPIVALLDEIERLRAALSDMERRKDEAARLAAPLCGP